MAPSSTFADAQDSEGEGHSPERAEHEEKSLSEKADALAAAYGLTSREREIALYLISGRSRPYIRDRLYISLNTVNTHVRNIYKKACIGSLQELIDLSERL